MLSIFFANAFYKKIVDNQCELYPKAGYQFALSAFVSINRFSSSLLASNPDYIKPDMPHLVII